MPRLIQRLKSALKSLIKALLKSAFLRLSALLSRPLPPRPKNRLLILRTDAIGDFILFSPYIKAIRAHYKDAHITLLASVAVRDLAIALHSGDIDEFIFVSPRAFSHNLFYRARFLRRLRKRYFSLCLHPVHSRDLLSFEMIKHINAARILAPEGDCINMPIEKKLESSAYYTTLTPCQRGVMFEYYRHSEFFSQIFKARILPDFRLDAKAFPSLESALNAMLGADSRGIIARLCKERFCVLFIGASSAYRKWSVAHFGAVGAYIAMRYGENIIICGGREDRENGERLVELIRRDCSLGNIEGDSSLGNHLHNPSAPLHCGARPSAPHSQGETIPQSNTAKQGEAEASLVNTRIVANTNSDYATDSESTTNADNSPSLAEGARGWVSPNIAESNPTNPNASGWVESKLESSSLRGNAEAIQNKIRHTERSEVSFIMDCHEFSSENSRNDTHPLAFGAGGSESAREREFSVCGLESTKEGECTAQDSGNPAIANAKKPTQRPIVINLAGETTLPQLASLVYNASVVISNETACAHLSVALDTVIIAVSNGNHLGRFIPYPRGISDKHYAVLHPFIAANPDKYEELSNAYAYKSDLDIDEIPPSAVIEVVNEIFKSKKKEKQ